MSESLRILLRTDDPVRRQGLSAMLEAAGHALVNAAGGVVTEVDGSPLRYGKPEFKNPDILVMGGR